MKAIHKYIVGCTFALAACTGFGSANINGVGIPLTGDAYYEYGTTRWSWDEGRLFLDSPGGVYIMDTDGRAALTNSLDCGEAAVMAVKGPTPELLLDVLEEVNPLLPMVLSDQDYILHSKPRKIAKHLYEVQCDYLDYEIGATMMEIIPQIKKTLSGGCTSCWNGKFVGRNFDWTWDDSNEYIIRMPAKEGVRNASIGIASTMGIPEVIDLGIFKLDAFELTRFWEWVPCIVTDGINDHGVEANVNIVTYGSAGLTEGTNPKADLKLPNVFVVRYLLDNADSASAAVELLKNVNIYSSFNMETHWMIADTNECYIAECVSNKLVIVKAKDKQTAMSNFHISNSPLLDEFDIVYNGLWTSHEYLPWSIGIERYDRATNGLAAVNSRIGMLEHMRNNWFARGFYMNDSIDNHEWWSENNGAKTGLTDADQIDACGRVVFPGLSNMVWTTAIRKENYADVNDLAFWYNYKIQKEKRIFNEALERERLTGLRYDEDGEYLDNWQTVHSAAYDLENKVLSVMVQENYVPFRFGLYDYDYTDWPYGESSTSGASNWKNPSDYSGNVGSALSGSGVHKVPASIGAEGYERLIGWASSMGLEASQIDDKIDEPGSTPLLCAALYRTASFNRSDAAFGIKMDITGFEVGPDKVAFNVGFGEEDLSLLNMPLLNAALTVEGSDSVTGVFSSGNLKDVSCDFDEESGLVIEAAPQDGNMTNFFYRVNAR